jgi:hypothetical protein
VLDTMRGKRPDITPAQIVAAVFGALGPVLVLLGVDLDPARDQALDQLKWIALGLFGADAAIRVGRNVGQSAGDDLAVEDPEVEAVSPDELPDDDEEFASLGGPDEPIGRGAAVTPDAP